MDLHKLSFREFYFYYLTEHRNPVCRGLHFVGTGCVIGLLILFTTTTDWKFFALAPLFGYGFAWLGHFVFEKNKPAAFAKPLWSLYCDFVMFFHILTFQLPRKMHEANTFIFAKTSNK